MNWYFSLDETSYYKIVSTFISNYINTTVMKERSLLKHFLKIGYDFNIFVDDCLSMFFTCFY